MRRHAHISFPMILARIILLALPTIAIVYFLLYHLSTYFTLLQAQYISQTFAYSCGLIVALICASYRLRFTTTSIISVLLYIIVQKVINHLPGNEFDGFFIAVQFKTFSILYLVGWLCGFGLIRIRWFSIVMSVGLLLSCFYIIAKISDYDYHKFIVFVLPVLVYSFYIIYIALYLFKKEQTQSISLVRTGLSLAGLLLFLLGTFSISLLFVNKDLKALFNDNKGKSDDRKNSLIYVDSAGNVNVSNEMSLGLKNEISKELLFCAKIDNYFDGSSDPNPLYLTSGHFNKFDTLSETFEVDPSPPFDDDFLPDVKKIPLYFTVTDSTKLKNALASKYLKTVEIEVYKKKAAANLFCAPTTSFYVQPITIDKNFRKEFQTAYRAKSVTSQLNSAYFVYNAEDPFIHLFQQQRFEVLRKAKPYTFTDSGFLRYYTQFPAGAAYSPIQLLADSLAKGKETTIDKVLAVRDFFMQRNKLGEQVYKYTDNPGIPGLPGKSKLTEFLFESKKGYCAYYAGATLFLLRAMHIPSRVSVGFSTIDRSSKNKGWYWYYANQAHAWVQVYFPEYGWLDFDTTVPNEDMEQSPQPDGTPPLQPPKPTFVEGAIITAIDSAHKRIRVKPISVILNDKEYKNVSDPDELDISHASIIIDSATGTITQLHKNDVITAISYDEQLTRTNKPADLQQPMPVDEIYYISKLKDIQSPAADKHKKTFSINWWRIALKVLILLLLSFITLPFTLLSSLRAAIRGSKNNKEKAYNIFNFSMYYLHQMGITRGNNTAIDYASSIDREYNTRFHDFVATYNKLKYSQLPLDNEDYKNIDYAEKDFHSLIKRKFTRWQRFKLMMRPIRAIEYLLLKRKYKDTQ